MDAWIPFVLLPVVAWGVRHKLIGEERWGPLKRITLTVGMVAWFVTELGRSFYRPWIYANDIDDWVVADTIGNSFGTVTAIFMILTMAGRGTSWDWRLVGIVIVGLVGYEATNLAGHHGFDVNDVLATLLFGSISAVIYSQVLARHGGPTVRR